MDLPPEVVEALARYRRLLAERGPDWGDERVEFSRFSRFALIGPVFERYAVDGDWAAAVRAVVAEAVGGARPPGLVTVSVDRDGVRIDTGPARPAIAGHPVPVDVVVDSAVDADLTISVAGRAVPVTPRGVAVETVDVEGAFEVVVGDRAVSVDGAVVPAATAWLRLRSSACSRWSVTDEAGGAWFADGVPHKWDFHGRPFFHGHDVSVAVPAGSLRVACARGLEFERTETVVHVAGGGTLPVELDPRRVHDPAARGWYGGDLHVHLNYSGDQVCAPADAARMQRGEGLHLLNLVAGNFTRSLVYDRELLEAYAGRDLPWSDKDVLARMGVEYRNDLLGHVHALGPRRPPDRYHSGHERSEHPDDWPPNAVACQELRDLDAVVGYAHPAWLPFPDDGATDRFFASPRSVEARELVADAALGLVDSVDVISPADHEGAAFLYHRLLSCGLRLAATAGTDCFLSFARNSVASNPPGWGRVYAHLGDRKLSVPAFADAIRAGRTVVTNGPWLDLEVNGNGPGAVLDLAAGDRIEVRAAVTGPGADRLTLVGPDGVIAGNDAATALTYEGTVDGPLWIAAVARGPGHPAVLDSSVFAHTSPVYVDVAGRRVVRRRDARWCLDFLDSVERLVREHGRFAPATRDARLGDVLAVLERARAYYRQVAVTADEAMAMRGSNSIGEPPPDKPPRGAAA